MAEFIKLEGALSWVKTDQDNPEPPFGDEKAGKWSVNIHPNAEGLELVRELQAQGIKNKVKKDDDGWYTKFSRPCEIWKEDKLTKEKKLVKKLEAPKLTGATSAREIGNGSLGTLTLDIYEHGTPGGGKAKAARLYAVDITRLTPRA